MTNTKNRELSPADAAGTAETWILSPHPPRLCEGYGVPPAGGIRCDRETGQWFAATFDPEAGPVEHGPFATYDQASAALASLLGDPAK